MKYLIPLLISFAIMPTATGADGYPYLLQSPGSVCQPTTPEDARHVSYLDGAVTVDKPASVTCPLPSVLPFHVQGTAQVTYWSGSREWKGQQCEFFNGFPTRSQREQIYGLPGREHIGRAVFHTEKAGFVAHAAVCTVLPGQMLYGVSINMKRI